VKVTQPARPRLHLHGKRSAGLFAVSHAR
jgi:hypothetical protein